MVYNSLELNLEAITNTIKMLEKENNDENKDKIAELKKETYKLLKELKVIKLLLLKTILLNKFGD